MSFRRTLAATLLAFLGLGASGQALRAADLKEGDKAPAFEAWDQDGRTVRLADFAGKSNVVLYFYPKDDTPGCTAQACALRDGHGALLASGAVVLGVSADGKESHKAFATKFGLPFPLLADPERKIIQAYGVGLPLVGMARRVTFVIDKQGVVRRILRQVDTRSHDQQVLAVLKTLG